MTVDLPEHIAEGETWKQLPRSLDAHLVWGVRRRQIEAFTRNGKLTVYICPDETKRLDPDALREQFGPPLQGRDRDLNVAERKAKQEQSELASGKLDPTVLMFGRAVDMMSALHQQLIGQLKLISEPLKILMDAHQQTIKAQADRIATLEQQADEAAVLRSELADAKQERDIALQRHQSGEKRRDQTLGLLKEELPKLVDLWLSGETISGFAKRAPRDVIETLIDSGSLSEQDADLLRRHAGIPPKPAPNPQSNGVSEHGHS